MYVRILETMSFRSLMIFVTSCQTLNLTRCAELLDLPKSTISKEITKLENLFKTKLLDRSTRNIYITETGNIVYQRALQVIDDLNSLHSDVQTMEDHVQGMIKITAPPILGEILSTYVIPDFLKQWPKVSIHLNLSYSFDDLFAEGYDLALRVGRIDDDRLVCREIGSSKRLLVASNEYLQRFGAPSTPEELSEHNCLRFQFKHDLTEWRLTSGSEIKLIYVRGNFFCANVPSLRGLALQGSGIAQLPISAIKDDLKEGRLVRVLPEWSIVENPIYLTYRRGLNKPKKLKTFLDYLDQKQEIFSLNIVPPEI